MPTYVQPVLEEAVEYNKKHLAATIQRRNICNKWTLLISALMIGLSVGLVSDVGGFQDIVKLGFLRSSFFTQQTTSFEKIEIPFHKADTIFHATYDHNDLQSRNKRASSSSISLNSAVVSGSGSGADATTMVDQSGDSTTSSPNDETTDPLEMSGDETTAPMDETTDQSGDFTTSSPSDETTDPLEMSGDETTAPMDETTDQSGDFTTSSPSDETTDPLEMSGDETTAPMDFSGDETTGPDISSGATTTDSMFDVSGDGTTAADDDTNTTTLTITTNPADTGGGGGDDATTPQPFAESTTAGSEITRTPVTETTVAAVVDDTLIPFYYAIIAAVAGIIFGVILVFAIIAFAKWLRKRKLVTPMPTPSTSQISLKNGRPPELNWLMAREDTLLKAMALGQISVLEFALVEARTAGLMQDNPHLMKDAEARMNQWKRTRTQLENAYEKKDLNNMDEFMNRFNELEMKDDTGCYQRCVDMKWNMKHAELNMGNAADVRSESMLVSSMQQFDSLNLQPATIAANVPYQNAARVMEELRQKKLLQGRTYDGLRTDLRSAVTARDPPAIAVAIDKFNKAEVPDEYDDITKANQALEEIELERKENLAISQKKVEEACFARDQNALRESIGDCKKFGASVDDLKGPEKLLRVIEREDVLLAEMRNLTAEGDIAKLSNAIVVFKTPVVDMVDKTGDVAKAEEVLEKLQEREKMRRTKGDVMWRLQNAMAIGDVTAMDGMIKALQSLAASGEEIDEAFLIRAIGELEACRGQVDYRKKMEAIKSAIARTIASENIPQLQDLVDQMSDLAEDEKYTMTADDSRVLDASRTSLDSLQRKAAVVSEITAVKPDLTLAQIPQNLNKLKSAVDKMTIARKDAEEFHGVFTEEDAVLLEEARINTNVLDNKVESMMNARERLHVAVEEREYIELKHAIRNAINAPFIEKKELVEPRKLAIFLDPKARRMAVKTGMRARNIPLLGVALEDFKEAKVDDENLLLKGERTLDKLEKRERRKEKQEKRKEKEDARRAADIARLTAVIKSAIASGDTEHLQLALEEFEESGYDEEDIPEIAKAEELFDTLKIQDLRNRLQDSIKRRDLTGLENAIDDADYGGFVMDVKEEYDVAKDLLYHLRELNNLREAIAEMNRSLISEIHKYPTPPPAVHQVMSAAFILLGESPKKLQNWIEVQALLGKLGQNNITRRVRICVPGDIPSAAVKKAEQHIRGLKLEELSEISKGAATFFAWTTCMVRENAQVLKNQDRLTDIELPDIELLDRPHTSHDYAWVEKNA